MNEWRFIAQSDVFLYSQLPDLLCTGRVGGDYLKDEREIISSIGQLVS